MSDVTTSHHHDHVRPTVATEWHFQPFLCICMLTHEIFPHYSRVFSCARCLIDAFFKRRNLEICEHSSFWRNCEKSPIKNRIRSRSLIRSKTGWKWNTLPYSIMFATLFGSTYKSIQGRHLDGQKIGTKK